MVNPLTPNPEYPGSSPDIPRQTSPDFRQVEFGFQASDPEEDEFQSSDQVRFGSEERAMAIGDQKEVGSLGARSRVRILLLHEKITINHQDLILQKSYFLAVKLVKDADVFGFCFK